MKVTLFVRAPKKPEKRVVVERDVVIGRGKDCNLQVLSNDVSRRHCQFVIGESEVAVRDLGSGNGTLINSQKTEPNVDARLISGDIVQVGPLVIKVEFDSAPAEPELREPAGSPDVVADSPEELPTPAAAEAAAVSGDVQEIEEAVSDEAATDQFLESADDDDELLPDDDSADGEFAEANPLMLEPDDPDVVEPAPVKPPPGKMKSLFGMFGRKKNKEAAADAAPAPADTKSTEESGHVTAESLLVAGNAEFDEETVVFDQQNAFTPNEDEPDLLADEGLSDEADYLDDEVPDDEVEDEAVDPGFADFLNNVDPPPS
jgi:pSer/pThr/pTyr-binding forkhead associated (FHA) protein